LLLVGDGSLRVEVERRGDERVRVLGLRTDIPEILAACDIFALASKYEGVPVAVIEAMAAGLPVVAPRVGGIPELVEDGVTGFVGDVRTGLARLVADRELRKEMGARGERRAQLFNADRMVRAYAALFEEMAENPQ
jgi:glycosyltransferase involved in cell wall biosynthesis